MEINNKDQSFDIKLDDNSNVKIKYNEIQTDKEIQNIKYCLLFLLDNKNLNNIYIHWGLGLKNKNEWVTPPKSIYPENTFKFDDKAAQTLLSNNESEPTKIDIEITKEKTVKSFNFVILNKDNVNYLE